MNRRDVTGCFRAAHAATASLYGAGSEWWPSSQTQSTTLAMALGLEWLENLHADEPWWIWSTWGTGSEKKAKLLKAHGVRYGEPGERIPPSNLRRQRGFWPRQYLVDFCVGPHVGNRLFFTMESEVYGGHGVGDDIVPANDYAWDFAKLLYVRADFRVFVARVGRGDEEASAAARRRTLWESLTKLCSDKAFEMRAPLIVYVLAQGTRARGESSAGIWRRSGFERFDLI